MTVLLMWIVETYGCWVVVCCIMTGLNVAQTEQIKVKRMKAVDAFYTQMTTILYIRMQTCAIEVAFASLLYYFLPSKPSWQPRLRNVCTSF